MLKVLAIVGIVIGSIVLLLLLLFLLLLFVPFRYKIGGSNVDTLYGYFVLSYLLSIFRIKVYYREKNGWLCIRIFGIKIIDKTFPEVVELIEKISAFFDKKKKDETGNEENADGNGELSTNEETIPTEDTLEHEITEEEAIEFLNEHDEIEDMNAVEKNVSFLRAIKDFVLNIREKWYNFKEFVETKLKQWEILKKYIKFYWKVLNHPSFAKSLELFKNVGIRILKHIFPRKWRMRIVYGDEDPYTTGKVSSYICMARGLFNREIDFTPFWEENRFEIDGYISGRIQLYVFLSVAFKLFVNKHLRRIVILIIKGHKKGGKSRGRK